jgi:hypothetical protein
LQSAQFFFTLPCGHGLQTRQCVFCLPCKHRFVPIARGRSRGPPRVRLSRAPRRVVAERTTSWFKRTS